VIKVVLPLQLRRLAKTDSPVALEVAGPVTTCSILDALEARFPALLGTTRDRHSKQRRAYIRFFACGEDWSDVSIDQELPTAIVEGRESFMIVGAMSGG
jgi:hypothetical protein